MTALKKGFPGDTMKRIATFLMLAALATGGAGCVIAAIGAASAGTVVFVRGEIESYFDTDVQNLYDATLKAMGDLKLYVIDQKHDALSAEVVARNSADQKVTVKIDGSRREAVKMTIRVGFWGDETASRAILDRISANRTR
jgi:hypothetical protein